MTAKVHDIDVRDEKGSIVHFKVQVGPGNSISCWTPESEGGAITVQELFSVCCLHSAAKAREPK